MAVLETNGDGRAINPSGVYRHPDTGEELVTQATAKFGNPQADAIVRLGFVYVGPADNNIVPAAPDPSAGPIANTDPSTKTVAGLQAELDAAKDREAAVAKAQQDPSTLVEKSDSKKTTKTETVEVTEKGGAK